MVLLAEAAVNGNDTHRPYTRQVSSQDGPRELRRIERRDVDREFGEPTAPTWATT